MPHIVAKRFEEFPTPKEVEGVKFLWFANPFKNAAHALVGVEAEGKRFLLEIKKRAEDYLIKADKVTRVSPLFLLKKALKSFCEAAECEILHHNLSSIKPSHAQKANAFLKTIDFFLANFPQDKDIWIEIGFGSGRHLLYQAKNHPDKLFIGIEIHKPSIEQLLGQIALQKLKNILVIDYDARLFLEFVPSNRVERIFVHFPVPWDKKPHRRVISQSFIQEAKRVLRPEGFLELRTDSRLYFDYAMELFLEQEQAKMEVTKNLAAAVSSKYEDRWVRFGKDIYDIRLFCLEKSGELQLGFDFAFGKVQKEALLGVFDTKPKVYENYFIHFEKMYKIDEERFLIEVSFGSFDKPEHSYLFYENGILNYFAKKPVPSRANIAAHKKIKELIDAQECHSS